MYDRKKICSAQNVTDVSFFVVLQRRGTSRELSQPIHGGAGMPCPLLIKGTWISNPSVPPRTPGVLRPPAAQFYSRLHITHRWLCRLLRAVSGLQSSFRAMEEAVLPRTPYTRGVDISSGRSRDMAHRRDRIPVRYSEEDIRGLAFGVVLYGGRPPSGPYSDGPS